MSYKGGNMKSKIGMALILTLLSLVTVKAYAIKQVIPLKDITEVEAIQLRCISSEYEIMLPIPERWEVKKASIEFGYYNSAALLKRTSQLVIGLNGVPLSQIKLDPLAPEGYAEIELPPLLLESDYNSFRIAVSQHYATECELPCMPELWTRVMMNEAKLNIEYELKPVPLRLSSVSNFLFDPKTFPQGKVHIVSTEKPTDERLTVLGMTTSGIALRYDYRKALFTYGQTLVQGQDNVLIGSHEEVTALLSKYDLSMDQTGPSIKLFHLPNRYKNTNREPNEPEWMITTDPQYALLVIAGDSSKDLKLAAETVDIMSIPFPDSQGMNVREFHMPEIALYSGKQILLTDREYPLKKLQFNTRTFRGFNASPTSISFRVPSDFMVKPNEYVELSLDIAYGAALRYDSALNVLLNGHHVGAIHLDDQSGSIITGYKLRLPTHLFQGGLNKLAFDATLTPFITENCSYVQSENLFLTLFDSSTILFPEMPHRVEMPNLSLFFVNGFPYTRWPDGYESKVFVTQPTNESISSAMNLVGLLTQKNGYPLFGLEMTTQKPNGYQGELMVIGPLDTIPDAYFEKSPLKIGEENQVPYPVFESWDQKQALAFSRQESGVGDKQGIILQMASPYKIGRTMTIYTSKHEEGVAALTEAILDPGVQSAATGDLVLVDYIYNEYNQKHFGNGLDYQVVSLTAGDTYVTGKGGQISQPDYYLSKDQRLYWAALIGGLVVLSILIYLILKRRHKARE
jgi:hypothetical protein